MQAVAVLQRCEHRMGQKIPQADLDAGRIGQYLQPEDYKPLQDVSSTVFTITYYNPCLGIRRAYAVNMHQMYGRTPGVRRAYARVLLFDTPFFPFSVEGNPSG